MAEKRKWYQSRYIQEAGFFIAMFILTMLHEWIQIDTLAGFIKGLAFFLVLYLQAKVHRYFVFPLYLQKRFSSYAVVTILSTLAGATLLYTLNYYLIEPDFYHRGSIWFWILYHFVICLISTITIMSLFLIRQFAIELKQRSQDQLMMSEMNIKFLHAQLNPHFFFNMFNNLYGVSLTAPERTPQLILKLSNLMRYQLENGNKPLVSIAEEIQFIADYIVMEKERIGKRCEISFSFPSDQAALSRFRIAPLILITLIENAFKHSLTITRKWSVKINIEISTESLVVCVTNSLPDESLTDSSTGIGLGNIRQRLELLYKDGYQFVTTENEMEYKTILSIQLNRL
ncbi:sensor histidine kinase [Pedobacter steynii]|uniref:Histidine kinase n=1 Tax=Pedobacter steynii TaxID=430522 RepID=A0A1D7QL25_9SPHI|nr:histidine kinase [Pedobacter steynii]AOM79350.1 histidine kinase [Pedobacter steynii]